MSDGTKQTTVETDVLLSECQRLLELAGWRIELHDDVTVLSAGAVRSSFALAGRQEGRTRPARSSVKLVAQLSMWADSDVPARSGPLRRLPAAIEYQAVRAAGEAAVPVAPAMAFGSSKCLGADVLLTGWMAGESIPRRVLRTLSSISGGGRALTVECARALAALHTAPQPTVSGLPELSRRRPFHSHIVDLTTSLDDLQLPYPSLRYGIWWLAANEPETFPDPRLIHGDFRLGNLLVDGDALCAVVDWELAHAGDPMCDLAWLCLRTWRFGNDDHEVGGFGRLPDLRLAYAEAGGEWDDERFQWWSVARAVWWGIGLAAQSQAFDEQFQDGTVGSVVHAASGRRVVELEYDLLNLIGELDGF